MASFDVSGENDVPSTTGEDMLSVSVEWHGGVALLGVSGEVDALSAPRLERVVSDALEGNPKTLIIDLTKVGFLASAGLSVLANTHRQISHGIDFRVVAEGSATGRPLHLTGLDHDFAVYPSRDEALTTEE